MQMRISPNYGQQLHKNDTYNKIDRRKAKLEEREIELQNTMRWEDDGGQIIEVNGSTIDLHSYSSIPVHGVHA